MIPYFEIGLLIFDFILLAISARMAASYWFKRDTERGLFGLLCCGAVIIMSVYHILLATT